MKLNALIEKLIARAQYQALQGTSEYYARKLQRGEEVDPRYMPGGLVVSLSEEERALLANLKAEDLQHRPY